VATRCAGASSSLAGINSSFFRLRRSMDGRSPWLLKEGDAREMMPMPNSLPNSFLWKYRAKCRHFTASGVLPPRVHLFSIPRLWERLKMREDLGFLVFPGVRRRIERRRPLHEHRGSGLIGAYCYAKNNIYW